MKLFDLLESLEYALNEDSIVFRMLRNDKDKKKWFYPSSYRAGITGTLEAYKANDLILEIDNWFSNPNFGMKKTDWNKLLQLSEKSNNEKIKHELHRYYNIIISHLSQPRSLLFHKMSEKISENIYPVLVAGENKEIIGRGLVYQIGNYSIIFKVRIWWLGRLYTGFLGSLLTTYRPDPCYTIEVINYDDYIGEMYLDDFVVISSSKNGFDSNISHILDDFYKELEELE